MNYAGIKYCDVANGSGCRTVLFVSGCRNHCKNCFQPHTWDFDYGQVFDEKIQNEIAASLKPDYIKGLTLLGGEPFEPENQSALLPFVENIKRLYPNKDIWAFTGYVYDVDLIKGGKKYGNDTDSLLDKIDVLVDGPFLQEQKNVRLKFRGSENQRIIDMKKTRKTGEVVLYML